MIDLLAVAFVAFAAGYLFGSVKTALEFGRDMEGEGE